MSTMREALTAALHDVMTSVPDAIMLGEALDTRGGASQITYGFLQRYGKDRVIETPISENALVGMAFGAALAGLPAIAEVYSADFLFCAGSEVINDIAKWRYQHQWASPIRLVLRMPAGSAATWAGPEHTQSIEGILQNVPGIRIVVPGTPEEATAALKESVSCGDPVIFLEHRSLYDVSQPVDHSPDRTGTVSQGRVVRHGSDLTLVAWGAMRRQALEAAELLSGDSISVEVVDPITVKPLNFELIAQSVERTQALLVVDEGPRTGGIAAEVLVRALEETSVPRSRLRRLTFPDAHHPFDPELEAQLLPNADRIRAASRELLAD